MKNNPRYYRTQHFNLACFLLAKGLELVNIDRLEDSRRATFVFVNQPDIEELVHEFNFAKEDEEAVLVDARKIFYAMKTLKEKLYA